MQIFTGCSQVHCYDGLSVNISTLSVSTTICEIWKWAYLFCLRAWASRQDSKESGTCFVFTYQHNLLLLSAWNLCKLWQVTEKQYPINIFFDWPWNWGHKHKHTTGHKPLTCGFCGYRDGFIDFTGCVNSHIHCAARCQTPRFQQHTKPLYGTTTTEKTRLLRKCPCHRGSREVGD